MDFNQLYFDHQLLLMQAESAPTQGLRSLHEVAASHVAGRIACMQRAAGATSARAWDTLAIAGAGSLAAPGRHLEGYPS